MTQIALQCPEFILITKKKVNSSKYNTKLYAFVFLIKICAVHLNDTLAF